MTPKEAREAIQAERERQVSVEGWTPDHDDRHDNGEMLRAAVIYYQHAARPDIPLTMEMDGRPLGWPWDAQWWKPKDRERDLVRAGALCLAERDRILRWHGARTVADVSRGLPWLGHVDHKYELIVSALGD